MAIPKRKQYKDDRPEHIMHNYTYDEKCTITADIGGVIITTEGSESTWFVSWERLKLLKNLYTHLAREGREYTR